MHHTKHHQAYISKLNDAVAKAPELQGKSILQIQQAVGTSKVPDAVAGTVRNNGGGTWNHAFFWKVMKPKGKGAAEPVGELAKAISAKYGSVDDFKVRWPARVGDWGVRRVVAGGADGGYVGVWCGGRG